jgi:hypothetical protein
LGVAPGSSAKVAVPPLTGLPAAALLAPMPDEQAAAVRAAVATAMALSPSLRLRLI